jgi:hypothetical protein
MPLAELAKQSSFRAWLPGSGDSYLEEPWEEWLSNFSPTKPNGLWLADGTGEYPDYALNDLLADSNEKRPVPLADAGFLRSLAGIDITNQTGKRLIIDALWDSPDGVHVSISSVLVRPTEARLAALALATASSAHMWLPTFRPHEEDDGAFREDTKPCEPWVTHPYVEVKIDEHDPNGSRAAVARPRPSRQTIETCKLASIDPWSEVWSDGPGRVAFRSRAWGRRTGKGEREVWEAGTALECDRRFLAELLRKLDRDMVLLIKLGHYRRRERYGEDDGDRRFGAKPRKNFVDDQAASPSSWKTPRMAVWMAA